MSEKTYWNGEPTRCERVTVKVGPAPFETWWCAPLVGTVRNAVAVYYAGEGVRLLDDEDGSGWRKVTEGHGGPRWPHRGLPDTSEILH